MKKPTKKLKHLISRGAHETIWSLIGATNAYIETSEPFKVAKTDLESAQAILGDCLEALRAVCLMSYPAMPETAAELWRRLGLQEDTPIEKMQLPEGIKWGKLPCRAET